MRRRVSRLLILGSLVAVPAWSEEGRIPIFESTVITESGKYVVIRDITTSLAVSVTGLFFHLQRFFRFNFERAPESLFMNFAGWMVSMASLMTIGLLVAILAALVWFVLASAVARAERREMETLLGAAS